MHANVDRLLWAELPFLSEAGEAWVVEIVMLPEFPGLLERSGVGTLPRCLSGWQLCAVVLMSEGDGDTARTPSWTSSFWLAV